MGLLATLMICRELCSQHCKLILTLAGSDLVNALIDQNVATTFKYSCLSAVNTDLVRGVLGTNRSHCIVCFAKSDIEIPHRL